jgi:recombinational DNA repair protein RecR
MEMSMTVKLLVSNADELRDALPTSGLFEMADCVVLIDCPIASNVQEVKQMVSVVESVINVVDVEISSYTDGEYYIVEMIEVPIDLAEGRPRKF